MISYEISKQPTYQAIATALQEALELTSDCLYRRTFHSDQGWAYQMKNYVFKLKSKKNNPIYVLLLSYQGSFNHGKFVVK